VRIEPAHLDAADASLVHVDQEISGRRQLALEARQQKLAALETAFQASRAEVDRLNAEMMRTKTERERRMQSMRQQLVEVGRLITEIREKGRLRGLAMERLDAANREVGELERTADQLVARLKGRRHEAQRTIRDYNRTVRDTLSGHDAYARAAEAQLEELLKRGRVTLRG